MPIYLKLILSVLVFILVDITYLIVCKEYKLNKKFHVLAVLGPCVCLFLGTFIFELVNKQFLLCLVVFELLLILSFNDYKFYMVDKHCYYFLICCSLLQIILFSDDIWGNILSIAIVFAAFQIFHWLVGIKNLGGGDVKVMLSLSGFFHAFDIFSFILYAFLITCFMFVIVVIKKKNLKEVKVPMIIAITISFFIQQLFILGVI